MLVVVSTTRITESILKLGLFQYFFDISEPIRVRERIVALMSLVSMTWWHSQGTIVTVVDTVLSPICSNTVRK